MDDEGVGADHVDRPARRIRAVGPDLGRSEIGEDRNTGSGRAQLWAEPSSGGTLDMVQLWVNLPARDKMAEPGYQTILDTSIPTWRWRRTPAACG